MDIQQLALTYSDEVVVFHAAMSGRNPPELKGTFFKHPQLAPVKYKTSNCGLRASSGKLKLIQVLARACLLAARERTRPEEYSFHDAATQTVGEAIKRAADYSANHWTAEIFGHNGGQPLIGTLLQQTETQNGYTVTLNTRALPPTKIHIHWEDTGDISHRCDLLEELISALEAQFAMVSLRDFLLWSYPVPTLDLPGYLARQGLLDELHERGRAGKTDRLVVVRGDRGVGKTVLASRWACHWLEEGDSLLWTGWEPGASFVGLFEDFCKRLREHKRCADDLRHFRNLLPRKADRITPELVEKLARELARHDVHLVFDAFEVDGTNAEPLAHFARCCLAEGGRGTILLTTRSRNALSALSPRVVTVPDLRMEETADYFRRYCPDVASKFREADFTELYHRSAGKFEQIQTIATFAREKLKYVPLRAVWRDLPSGEDVGFDHLPDDLCAFLGLLTLFRPGGRFDFDAVSHLFEQAAGALECLDVREGAVPTLDDLLEQLIRRNLVTVEQAADHLYAVTPSTRERMERYLSRQVRPLLRPDPALHASLARFYEQRGASPANLIEAVYHKLKAGPVSEGILFLIANEKFLFDLGSTTALEECLRKTLRVLPAEELHTPFLAASDKLLQGRIAYYHGEFADALALYNDGLGTIEEGLQRDKARSDVRNSLDRLKMPALEQRGLTLRKLERFEEAIADFEECRRLAKRAGNRVWQAHAASNLGMIYRETGPCDKAIRWINEGLEHRRGVFELLLDDTPPTEAVFCTRELVLVQMADQHSLLAYCHLELGRIQDAERELEQAEQRFVDAGDQGKENYYLGRFSCARAFTHARQGHWAESLADAQRAYDYPRERRLRAGEIAGLYCLGIIHLLGARAGAGPSGGSSAPSLDQARHYLLECVKEIKEVFKGSRGSALKMARVYKALADAFESDRDHGGYRNLAGKYAAEAGKPLEDICHLVPLV